MHHKEAGTMEMLERIEQACHDNDHTSVRLELNTIASDDVKKEAFLKIIDYYENEEEKLPVGYIILFIEWLLKNGDLEEAAGHIEKLKRMGIVRERIAELIYEHVIRPDEAVFEDRFRRNLALLEENEMLISGHTFDFNHVKRNIACTAGYNPYDEEGGLPAMEKSSFMLVDLTDMKIIRRILDAGNYLYIIYDDLSNFYYLLLFQDLSTIRTYIEQNADDAENIVIFAGRDMDTIRGFFIKNALALVPQCRVFSEKHEEYRKTMEDICNQKLIAFLSFTDAIKAYYRHRDDAYYQELFLRKPSDIRVLIISTLKSTLNQFICRNWHDAFAAMGYNVKLLVEERPYERVMPYNIREAICTFKPDIVFNINRTVNTYFEEKEITDSLLWIMRYRDHNEVNYDSYEYRHENMFFLPHWWEFSEVLKERNVPEGRICYTVEGIDVNVFKKRDTIRREYACDIVSVNNAVGSEFFRLKFYLKREGNEAMKRIMHELYGYIQEMAFHDDFVHESEFMKILNEKCAGEGLNITGPGRQFQIWFYRTVTNCFYRRRVMDWIVDSGITEDIKVWGGSWSHIEKFRKYHMGVARHGEQLSEIYGSSRMSLSDNWEWNTHERNFEIMASGGFPLVRHIQPDAGSGTDVITNYFKEDEEVVLFYGKDDLLNKVQYYLDHPRERDEIAERGRMQATAKFSNMAVAQNTMDFVMHYYETGVQGK